MAMSPNASLRTIDEARGFVERHRIAGEADYTALTLNPWAVYERFKRDLAEEIEPDGGQWAAACRRLAEVLKV